MDFRNYAVLNTYHYRERLNQLSLAKWLIAASLLVIFASYPLLFELEFNKNLLVRLCFGGTVLGFAWASQSQRRLFRLLLIIVLTAYLLTTATIWAWAMATSVTAFFITLGLGLGHILPHKIIKGGFWAVAGGLNALFLVALNALEINFSEEEFFVALSGVSIFLGWFLLAGAYHALQVQPTDTQRQKPRRAYLIWVGSGIGVGIVLLIFIVAIRYPQSFYTPTPPSYTGISEQNPFLCGQVPENNQTVSGPETFNKLLAQIEANDYKGTPEYGMLALGTKQPRWLDLFRETILAEARSGRFLGPNGSVKFSQHEAALRAYYLSHIMETFPNAFSAEEMAELRRWFEEINRQALSVGWVDLLYAAAFAKWPTGPYENQENGAGLLAQLEVSEYANPALSSENLTYLQQNVRGWSSRFKNTDDTYLYQREWVTNALFQAQFGEKFQTANVPSDEFKTRSFQWSLLQFPPDGFPLTYNHPYRMNFAGHFYLGALLTGEPHYVWVANRALTATQRGDSALLFAQPGVDQAVDLTGVSPTVGSCLMFSPSGLPNQKGPLAPDKIVFRSGWEDDSSYLLLDLRFTGWHRYKAVNTISSFYKQGPIVIEDVGQASYNWLPKGRSILRDKRVPRENLNGLLVPRQGLNQVIYQLTGLGGPWAQNPPFHARVDLFSSLGPLDVSRTLIEDWQGWQHTRDIFFFGEGPLIVTDRATNENSNQSAAISWHLSGDVVSHTKVPPTLRLDNGQILSEMILLGPASENTSVVSELSTIEWLPNQTLWQVTYPAHQGGNLKLTTLFLTDDWLGAKLTNTELYSRPDDKEASGAFLKLTNKRQSLQLWQNFSRQPLEAGDLSLDGYAVSLLSLPADGPIFCVVDVTKVDMKWEKPVTELTILPALDSLTEPLDWSWQNNTLSLRFPTKTSACFKPEG